MSSKNNNPYRVGSKYHDLFAQVRKKQVVTRQDLVEQGFSPHDVTVVLSPRAEGTGRGDCRGNMSAQGHVYYMEPLNKKKGETKRFRLRWRKTPLDALKRVSKKVEAVKESKAKETEQTEQTEQAEQAEQTANQ